MSDQEKPNEDTQEGTQTQHGRWTPEVSRAADEEMRRLAEEPDNLQPAKDEVDKSHLSLPKEQRPIDH